MHHPLDNLQMVLRCKYMVITGYNPNGYYTIQQLILRHNLLLFFFLVICWRTDP